MRSFDYTDLNSKYTDSDVISYLTSIHEYKGRQNQYINLKPDRLKKLIEVAKNQSTEASNEIEGIVTTQDRMRDLMNEKTTPYNRSEEEILGYRKVLDLIHQNYEYIDIKPAVILQLHKMLYDYAPNGLAGKYKIADNAIVKTEQGIKETVFRPASAFETKFLMEELCETYNQAISRPDAQPLLIIPSFIHDFLSIHPFNDGNGRMSRLLTTLLLYKSGFDVGKYIPLEKRISDTKENYYSVLQAGNEGWHEGEENKKPFIRYFLQIILSAYKELEKRIELIEEKRPVNQILLDHIKNKAQLGYRNFSASGMEQELMVFGHSTIQKALKELVEKGLLKKSGAGPKVVYNLVNKN